MTGDTPRLCLTPMPRQMIQKLKDIPDKPVCLLLEDHEGECYAGYGLTPWRRKNPKLIREDSK